MKKSPMASSAVIKSQEALWHLALARQQRKLLTMVSNGSERSAAFLPPRDNTRPLPRMPRRVRCAPPNHGRGRNPPEDQEAGADPAAIRVASGLCLASDELCSTNCCQRIFPPPPPSLLARKGALARAVDPMQTYVISLENDVGRARRQRMQLDKAYHLVTGVSPSCVPNHVSEHWYWGRTGTERNRALQGAFAAHWKVWMQMAAGGNRGGLVLEDDCVQYRDYPRVPKSYPTDGITLLGGCFKGWGNWRGLLILPCQPSLLEGIVHSVSGHSAVAPAWRLSWRCIQQPAGFTAAGCKGRARYAMGHLSLLGWQAACAITFSRPRRRACAHRAFGLVPTPSTSCGRLPLVIRVVRVSARRMVVSSAQTCTAMLKCELLQRRLAVPCRTEAVHESRC